MDFSYTFFPPTILYPDSAFAALLNRKSFILITLSPKARHFSWIASLILLMREMDDV